MQNNKTVIIFLAKFFGTYLLLFLIYSFYLSKNQKTAAIFACAPITKTVAEQSQFVLNSVGFDAKTEQHTSEMSIKLFVNNTYVARVVEGCNAISIIILFIAFIVAFASGFKKTTLYILFGSLVIYYINIVRIAIIALAMYKYPAYENILHSLIFPGIIYGITFLLWFIWIQKFSKLKR